MYEIETNIPFVEETFTSEDQFYSQSKDCKYKIYYQRLIERARNRTIEGYVEKHHIVPKCLGESNDEENLVKLTAEEHYLVHQILVKLFPENKKLIYAAIFMSSKSPDVKRPNNKVYSWLKFKMSEIQKGKPRPIEVAENISKANKARKGIKLSEEHKLKLSKAGKGRIVSKETREKLRILNSKPEAIKRNKELGIKRRGTKYTDAQKEKMKGRKLSEEHKTKLLNVNLGRKASEEAKAKMSIARKNPSQEIRYKMSKAQLGRKHSEETKAKISYNNSIRGVSEETKIKMSISHKNMSIETKLKIGESSKKARAIEKELGIGMYSKESIEKRRISIKESWNLRKLKQGCL